jgi:hypothetical protein
MARKPHDVVIPIPRANLHTVRLDGVEPQQIRWLWEPRFALGKVSLLSGDPGRGKSLVTIAMAAAVSRGFSWPVDKTRAPLGSVLMLSAEDDIADTIRPRLDAAGADVSRIHCATFVNDVDKSRRSFSLQTDVELLAAKLQQIGDCKLVVIDPVSAFTGSTDTHKNSDVRVLLASLAEIAHQFDVAILAVSHLNKGSSTAMYRTMGSLAFVAAARSVYAVADDPGDPLRRLVLPIKNNLGGDVQGLAYKIDIAGNGAPTVTWESTGVVDVIDTILSADSRENSSELSQAIEWLLSELSGGPVDTKALQQAAKEAGHAWRTVRRAQEKLGVKPKKSGTSGKWQWWHPGDVFEREPDE